MKLPEKEVVKPKLYKRNKLIEGVGINDADYNVIEVVDGKIVWQCPFYKTWVGMLNRCYSEKEHQRHPTYVGCKVCDEWLVFSNFKRWMEQQDWQGKHLDKDLLVEGNKVYSPDTCIFVDQMVNKFINDRSNARGEYMIGVTWYKRYNKFMAQCRNPLTGKRDYLGYFTNELQAHLAWKARKHELSVMLANSEYCTDERLREVLLNKYKD